jgi:hypothetical protein
MEKDVSVVVRDGKIRTVSEVSGWVDLPQPEEWRRISFNCNGTCMIKEIYDVKRIRKTETGRLILEHSEGTICYHPDDVLCVETPTKDWPRL